MTDPSGAQLLSLVGHWLSLWLGLYLFVRRPRSLPTMLVGAAIVSVSLYVLGTALLFESHAVSEATEWWAAFATSWVYFGPVLLLHGMLRLTRGSAAPRTVRACARLRRRRGGVRDELERHAASTSPTCRNSPTPTRRLNLGQGRSMHFRWSRSLRTAGARAGRDRAPPSAAPRPSARLRRHLDLLLSARWSCWSRRRPCSRTPWPRTRFPRASSSRCSWSAVWCSPGRSHGTRACSKGSSCAATWGRRCLG